MGNTVGSNNSRNNNPANSESLASSEEGETERRFRERIGFISIIKNNTNNDSNNNKSRHSDDGPGDLVSSMQENTHSWASSVTSITNSLGGSFLHTDYTASRTKSNKTKGKKPQQPPRKTKNYLPTTAINGKGKTAAVTRQQRTAVSSPNLEAIEVVKGRRTATAAVTAISTGTFTTQSQSYSSDDNKSGSHDGTPVSQDSHSKNKQLLANNKSRSSSHNTGTNTATATTITGRPQMTEELLRDMQKKMAKVDVEQDSCMRQIKTMNQEMEHYRRSTLQKLQEKDDIINLNETQRAYLKQEMLQVKLEHQQQSTVSKQETRNVMRKVSMLQNQLTVVQLEKEAALAAAEALVEAAATAPTSATGITSVASNASSINDTKSNVVMEELKETVQDLLRQLETNEDEHQREQGMLHDEVRVLRKDLERLESNYIAVGRERDDARQQLASSQQQLDVETAMNTSDRKQLQDEAQKWKDRYEQEVRLATNQKKESVRLQTTAVTMGSRLGASILEGVQVEGNKSRTATTAVAIRSIDTDESDAYYARLVGKMEALSSTMTNHTHSGNVELRRRAPSPPPPPRVEVSPTCGSIPTYVPESNGAQSPAAFEETISIPAFLSKVW